MVVALAFFSGNLYRWTKSGIKSNPPPEVKSPLIKPVKRPIRMFFNLFSIISLVCKKIDANIQIFCKKIQMKNNLNSKNKKMKKDIAKEKK